MIESVLIRVICGQKHIAIAIKNRCKSVQSVDKKYCDSNKKHLTRLSGTLSQVRGKCKVMRSCFEDYKKSVRICKLRSPRPLKGLKEWRAM